MDFEKQRFLHKQLVASSLLQFTTKMFAYTARREYVIGEHHRIICDALMDVIRGKTNKLIINISPRYGKAIDVNTPMLTTKGWKRADEIKVGDCLFGSDGFPTEVMAVYPQGETDAFKVTFSDGTHIVTCSEHLWSVQNRYDRSRKKETFRVKSTKEILTSIVTPDGHLNWSIPSTEPIQGSVRDLPIDPYLFGCWLGDGYSHNGGITTMDNEIFSAFSNQYKVKKKKKQNAGKAVEYSVLGLQEQLRALGVLGDKRIPLCYQMASIEDRFALLQGMMDTDGTCNKKTHQCSLCFTKSDLLEDAASLIRGLGMFCTINSKGIFLRVNRNPFRLNRKRTLWRPLTQKHHTKRFISSIEKVEDRRTVCFTVDAEDHLYLAGNDFIVTHNTLLCSQMFIAYGLALNPASKFLHISYSGSLVQDNSMAVKDTITSTYFQILFPNVKIRKNDNTRSKWSTTAGGGEYATSTLGQITGFGAGQPDWTEEDIKNMDKFMATFNPGHFSGAIVIDDPLRPDDALSDNVRESINRRFETTIRNRVNSRHTPIIIVMQRLHEHDLCGYLQEIEPNEWKVVSLPVIQTDEEGNERALWPWKHTLEELYKIKHASEFVFETQYMQNPTPMEGLMYHAFRTYDELPDRRYARMIGNYTDSADTGFDFLCSICFDAHDDGYYVTDVLYTKRPMEYTEPAQANMVKRNQTDVCFVESNNGGRSYARNVERITREHGNRITQFVTFTQSKNKQIRIFTRSSEVNNKLVFPSNWEQLWPEFAHDMKSYRKEGYNAHDDAPDACTGIIEKCEEWLNNATDAQLRRGGFL